MIAALGDVCAFLNGGTPSRSIPRYFEGNIPWITGADIVGPVVESARSFITEEAIQNSATNRVPAGTVLLVTRTSVGKVAVTGTELCFSQDITALTPARQKLDTAYLVQFLRTQEAYFERLARGATIKGITREIVDRLEIPLPPLAEQRRIAAILEQAEALRAKRRHALAQLDTLTQSLFVHRFGDSIEKPKGCCTALLGEQLLFVTSGGRGWAEFYSVAGSRFIRSLDVQMNHVSDDEPAYVTPPNSAEARRTMVKAGDVLLTITGSRIGRVAPAPERLAGAFISQHVAILRTDPTVIDPVFLSFFLSLESGGQRQIAKAQYGQTKPGLNFEQIKSFKILFPPLPLQREFAAQVFIVQRLKAAQRASLAKLDALFASLQHRAFRGEL